MNDVLYIINDLCFRTNYPKLCTGISAVTKSKGDRQEWVRERCRHDKFVSRNPELCSNLDTDPVTESEEEAETAAIETVIQDIKTLVSGTQATTPASTTPTTASSSSTATTATSASSSTTTTTTTAMPDSSDLDINDGYNE